MTPALIALITQLAPIALKWGTEVTSAIIAAVKNVAPAAVTIEEIQAVFEAFRKYASLSDFEKEAGVIVNPDGSVSPQPVVPVPQPAPPATESTDVG